MSHFDTEFSGQIPSPSVTKYRAQTNVNSLDRPVSAPIIDISFTRNYGSSPSTCSVRFKGEIDCPVGYLLKANIGSEFWDGYVTSVGMEYSQSGTTTNISAIDRRIEWKAAEISSKAFIGSNIGYIETNLTNPQGNVYTEYVTNYIEAPAYGGPWGVMPGGTQWRFPWVNERGWISGVFPISSSTGKQYFDFTYDRYIEDQAEEQGKLIYYDPEASLTQLPSGDKVQIPSLVERDSAVVYPGETGSNRLSISTTKKIDVSPSEMRIRGARPSGVYHLRCFPGWDTKYTQGLYDNGYYPFEWIDPNDAAGVQSRKDFEAKVFKEYICTSVGKLDTSKFNPEAYVGERLVSGASVGEDANGDVRIKFNERIVQLTGPGGATNSRGVVAGMSDSAFESEFSDEDNALMVSLWLQLQAASKTVSVKAYFSGTGERVGITKTAESPLPFYVLDLKTDDSIAGESARLKNMEDGMASSCVEYEEGTVTLAGIGHEGLGNGVLSISYSHGSGGTTTTYQLNNKKLPLPFKEPRGFGVSGGMGKGAGRWAGSLSSPYSADDRATRDFPQSNSQHNGRGIHGEGRGSSDNLGQVEGSAEDEKQGASVLSAKHGGNIVFGTNVGVLPSRALPEDRAANGIRPDSPARRSLVKGNDPQFILFNDVMGKILYDSETDAETKRFNPPYQWTTTGRGFSPEASFNDHSHADQYDGGYAYACYAPDDADDMIIPTDINAATLAARFRQLTPGDE